MTVQETFAYLLITEPYNYKNNIDVMLNLLFGGRNDVDWDDNGNLSFYRLPFDTFNFDTLKSFSIKNFENYDFDDDYKIFLTHLIDNALYNSSLPFVYNFHSIRLPITLNINDLNSLHFNISSLPENISNEWFFIIKDFVSLLKQRYTFFVSNSYKNDRKLLADSLYFIAQIENRLNEIEAFKSKKLNYDEFFACKTLKDFSSKKINS
jgi:hypothetical protein